jgi:hypothetical protein
MRQTPSSETKGDKMGSWKVLTPEQVAELSTSDGVGWIVAEGEDKFEHGGEVLKYFLTASLGSRGELTVALVLEHNGETTEGVFEHYKKGGN